MLTDKENSMDLGAPELLIVLVIVLLLFGGGRVAHLGSDLGKGIREFRKGLNGEGEDKKDELPKA
jgi:sec-independent protein translocase protein TatA